MKKKRIVSAVVSTAMLTSAFAGMSISSAGAASGVENWTANTTGTPKWHTTKRLMEELNRGLFATVVADNGYNGVGSGVYLSWRLLGTESLENQAFDIYRSTSENGTYTKIKTTGAHDATIYTDTAGTASSWYKVVPAGATAAEVAAEKAAKPSGTFRQARGSYVSNGTSLANAFSYIDIPLQRPAPVARMGDGKTSYYYVDDSHTEGGQNDASVGDLDGDGDYEIVVKWNPEDSKDSAGADFTGRVYLDGYQIDPNNGGYMWRIDLGQNITAGPHYTQFMVYDFDGDGKSEIACVTARGSKDGQGNYVTKAGDTSAIRNITDAQNEASTVGTSGKSKGKNVGDEFYTIFDGETGKALCTTAAIPLNSSGYWGDSSYNRSQRYLAGVAYLDGVHPSLIECRGYYARAVIRAYSWDGESLTQQWEYNSGSSGLYSDGNHNLSIGDIDNDGCDEIVYGSASLDHDGKTVLGDTNLGHGDAMHLSDFNNDGKQEVFSVKEDKYKTRSDSFRVADSGRELFGTKTSTADNGRGLMDNIDDEYASTHPNAMALAWCASHSSTHDLTGTDLKDSSGNEIPHPATSSRSMTNFTVYWDGDLGRELLDDNQLAKFDASTGYTKRFYEDGNGYISGASNNSTKHSPTLTADIWGDWREEIILAGGKGQTETPYLRIFTSTLPTEYRLTTLMHDAQYRCAIAWQNVAYNQPPHTSYYIGKAALAKSGSTTLNYLAPATLFTSVTYEVDRVPVTGVSLSESSVRVEKGQTASIQASVQPSDATKKGIIWTSSNENVAAVAGGTVTAINPGTATITAETKDGGFKASCEVEVWSTPVIGINLPEKMSVGVACSKHLTAEIQPSNASDKKIIWSSSNPAVASVDDEGNVTGNTAGAALITAATNEGGYSKTCVINVTPLVRTDYTGEEKFTTTNTDTETVLSNATPSSGTLTQKDAKVGGEMHRSFTKLTENKAVLSFRYTTGSLKLDGANWNWDGHEYSFYVQLLGEEDRNILTLSQDYKTSAGTLKSKTGNYAEGAFGTEWSTIVDGLGNIQGSAKRWIVDIEFDYDNNSATATLTGTDSSWAAVNAQYKKTFDLGGLSLEKIKVYTTVDGSGTITNAPKIENLSYFEEIPAYGATTTLYEKNTTWYNPWTADDISDWTQTGGSALEYDSENGRIWYHPIKPAAAYSASKTFDVDGNALLTYDIDWYFGGSTSRAQNLEYLQLGNKLRIGWTYGYKTFISTDGGATYPYTIAEDGKTIADGSASIFNGSNASYTKHVQAVFDVSTKTLKSLTFDGTTVAKDISLGDDASVNSVSFGLQRAGGTDTWEYPCGIDSILVSQFVEGADPVAPTMAPTPSPSPTPTPKPTAAPTPTPTPEPTATPIPVEKNVTSFEAKSRITVSGATGAENEITFTNADNANNGFAQAIADISSLIAGETKYTVEFDSNVPSGSRVRIALVDASQRPGTSSKNSYDKTGVAVVEGRTDSSSYTINESKATYGSINATDTYVHTKIDVNTATKTVSITISEGSSVLMSRTDLPYLNDITINAIEFGDIINNSVATMKNVKVVTYESPEPQPSSKIEVGTPSAADGRISIKVKNNNTTSQPVKLIAAAYDENDVLTGISISEDKTLAAGESADITADMPDGGRLKLMLWDTVETMKNLIDAITKID